jgi:hypothetical protein
MRMATKSEYTPTLGPPSLDDAVRHAFEQDLDSKDQRVILLPAKYGANVSLELSMLRHKLRALQIFSRRHGTLCASNP